MQTADVSQWTLLTYPGISAVVVLMIGGMKKLFHAWIAGKEPHLGLSLSIILGIAMKLTVSGAFAGVHWVPHIVGLLFAAFGAKVGHDYLLNEIIKNKPEQGK